MKVEHTKDKDKIFKAAREKSLIKKFLHSKMGKPQRLSGRESTHNAGDGVMDSIPRSGRSPGEGNGNPLQSSCLENHMDRGAGWATVGCDLMIKTITIIAK